MPQIPFAEYVRPNGLRRDIHIDRPQAIYDKAMAIRKAGLELTLEKLPEHLPFNVSLCIEDTFAEEDIACELCRNSQDLIDLAVDKLILEFPLDDYLSPTEIATLDEDIF